MNSSFGVLKGVTILDRGQGMPTALVAKFLAELGAELFREEAVEKSPFEAIYPAFAAWGKAVRQTERHPSNSDAETKLLNGIDICITGGEDFPGIERTRSAEALATRFPRLIVLEVSAYPRGHQNDNRPGVDILLQAASGLCFEQFEDRPNCVAYKPSLYGAALNGLAGVLAALIERETSGRGQAVFTSLLEGAMAWATPLWADIEDQSKAAKFIVPKDVRPLIVRCMDGVDVHLAFGTPGAVGKTYRVLGIGSEQAQPGTGLSTADAEPAKFFGDVEQIAAHAARWRSNDLLAALRAEGVVADRVAEPGECWDHEQTLFNGVLEQTQAGHRHIGNPVIMRRGAGESRKSALATATRPLGNARVLDLGSFVAGPAGGVGLVDLGADVIKVEAMAGDAVRTMFRTETAVNRGKRNIKIDLKSSAGQEIVGRLCARANLVMSNFRNGVSARLGVDAETLQRDNPGIAVIECPAYGLEGPKANDPGFDMVMQAWCGHERRAGGVGNSPLWSRTVMIDHGAGYLNTLAALICLYHQARTGEPLFASVPLFHSGLYLLSELVQDGEGAFVGAPSLNQQRTGERANEAFYQTTDGWIAVAARDDAAGRSLFRALRISSPEPAPVLTWGDNEQTLIANALVALSTTDALAKLEEHNVWAEPCAKQPEAGLLKDECLLRSGAVLRARHPKFGHVAQIGALMHFSRSLCGVPRHAPLAGEHTTEILRELGYGEPEIQALYDAGIVA